MRLYLDASSLVDLVYPTPRRNIEELAHALAKVEKEQEKILAKQEKQKHKDRKAAEKELRKRHLELQDKETRKRIKRHDKRADRSGTNRHRDPWIKRVFSRRR